ncbi:MAG: DUF2461 domain-containing protein [Bacteroidota bacterium]
MLQKPTLDFLKNLKKNNNKAWFDRNKPKYLEAKQDVENLVQSVIDELGKTDRSVAGMDARKCVFRIYRDVRFSKDKSPYKTNMGASINPGGKKTVGTGYYIHVEPGASFVAGGIYMPETPQLNAIRQEIDYNAKEFLKIISDRQFKKFFRGFYSDDALKNPPKGYDRDHPMISYLKLRHFIVSGDVKDSDLLSRNAVKKLVEIMKAARPLNSFIQRALD